MARSAGRGERAAQAARFHLGDGMTPTCRCVLAHQPQSPLCAPNWRTLEAPKPQCPGSKPRLFRLEAWRMRLRACRAGLPSSDRQASCPVTQAPSLDRLAIFSPCRGSKPRACAFLVHAAGSTASTSGLESLGIGASCCDECTPSLAACPAKGWRRGREAQRWASKPRGYPAGRDRVGQPGRTPPTGSSVPRINPPAAAPDGWLGSPDRRSGGT